MQPKRPALVLCLAAPEDGDRLARWERHLLPLQRAGHLRLWSERLILAGEDRLQQMSHQVEQANFIVFLLSPDFFASDECTHLMECALMRQHNEQVTLVPLLLRPVGWQESPLGALPCLPSNGRPITSWRTADEAFQTCVEGMRRLLGLPMKDDALKKRQFPLPLKQRLQVIRGLQQEYRQRRDHSLQGYVAIELGLHERVDAIDSSARLVFHDTETEHPLPAGITIIQVYDRSQFGLLVLGAPGAGKTTLLLDLALELLQRAENDMEHPLPIILSLSSWTTKKGALADWFPEQLSLVYGIAKKVGAPWVENDQILFLLDGLDELHVSARSACVAAMNDYRGDHFVPLVVASRSREYEQQQARLILPVAVEIQPLVPEEVMTYLTRVGPTLAKVRAAIQTNTALQQLMTTPLMLVIVLLTYRNQEAHELPQSGSPKELQRQIFEKYIRRMLQRHEYRRSFSATQTLHSLVWLAQQMQQRQRTELYLETLQADWLSTRPTRLTYQAFSRLITGLFFGLFGGLLAELVFGLLNALVLGPINWLLLLAPFSALLFFGVGFGWPGQPGDIEPVEQITWSWEASIKGLVVGWSFGTMFGRLFFGLFGRLFGGFSGVPPLKNERLKPNQGIHTSGWNALRLGFTFFLFTGLLFGLPFFLLFGPFIGLLFFLFAGIFGGLFAGLFFGGGAYFQHYVLRLLLAQSHALPWRTVSFLEEATNCILLQRVGGGYRFIHPLLQEHFASLDVEAILEQGTGQAKQSS